MTISKQKSSGKLSAKVIEYVMKGIADGQYSPGSRIRPKEIAAELNMSLSPVRDAIEQLDKDGWIERFPQSGTYIKEITIEDIEEIYELRQTLEAEAVRLAAERITAQQLAELKAIAKVLTLCARQNDVKGYEEADTQFHKKIIESAHNKSLTDVFESVLRKTRCFFIALKATTHGQQSIAELENTPVSHKNIFEALDAGQTELTEQLIRNHVGVACEWNKAMARIRWLSKSINLKEI